MAWRQRSGKFNARRVQIDGHWFASGDEAKRYGELKLLVAAGEIQDLRPHPKYAMVVQGQHIGHYTPDFEFVLCATGEVIVEDVKSKPTRTEAYMLRKKLWQVLYGQPLTEIMYHKKR